MKNSQHSITLKTPVAKMHFKTSKSSPLIKSMHNSDKNELNFMHKKLN